MSEICSSLSIPRKRDEYRVFIFNPETDYALATGRTLYNVPARVVAVRRSMAFLPSLFASCGDAILLLDPPDTLPSPTSETLAAIKGKNIELLTPERLSSYIHKRAEKGEKPVFTPWGWNHTLLHTLRSLHIPATFLPSAEEIDTLRMLSHRRTAGIINKTLANLLPGLPIESASEFFSPEEAHAFCAKNDFVFLKAPWSSSGRGVVNSHEADAATLEKWIAGCIRRQGSVMIEKGKKKTGDFATEWWIEKGRKPEFLGFSMFRATPAGRYLGNVRISQKEIEHHLRRLYPNWHNSIIEAQRESIEAHVAPYYSGPAGIDMLTTEDESLVPCVEINLRFTMGMAELFNSL